MYDTVKNILESKTKEEAEQKLFGDDGIKINTQEYYQSIVSRFIRKKDSVAPKINNSLIFDLDKNVKDVWNIVFISKYVQERFFDKHKNEIEELRRKINEEKDSIPSKEEIDNQRNIIRSSFPKEKIGIEMNKYYTQLNAKKDAIKRLEGDLEFFDKYFSNTGWITIKHNSSISESGIENDLQELKKGLLILNRLRNCFEHNKVMSISEMVEINYRDEEEKGSLETIIPIDYLDGFAKGRIIVREVDKDIVEKTNGIASKILEKYNLKLTQIESFFYNVPPQNITKLLDYFNNDVEKIYKFPSYAFLNPNGVIELLTTTEIALEEIIKLPEGAFLYPKGAIELLKTSEIPIEKITKLPEGAFFEPKGAIELLKTPEIPIEKIIKLPKGAFLEPKGAIELLKTPEIDIEIITNLPPCLFLNAKKTKKLLMSSEVDKEMLSSLTSFFIKPKGGGEGLLITNEIDKEIVSNLPEGTFRHIKSESEELLVINGIDREIISTLPEAAFMYPEGAIKLLKTYGIDKEIVSNLPEGAFMYPEGAEKLLKTYGIDKDTVSNLPGAAFMYPKEVSELLKIPDIDKEMIEKLSMNIVLNFKNRYESQLREYLGIENEFMKRLFFDDFNRICKILIQLHHMGISMSKNISNKLFTDGLKIDNLVFLLSRVNNNVEQLDQFPVEFFTCDLDILKEMCGKYDYNLCRSIFGINDPKKISLLLYMNNVFSKYNRDEDFVNIQQLNPLDFVRNSAKLTELYASVNRETTVVNEALYTQDIWCKLERNDNIMWRDYDEAQEYIIRKLRNSSAHFRFKNVKDHNGNIDNDKIELYDEENDGTLDYIGVFDMDYLLEITRLCELDINKKFETEEVGRSR